MYVVICNGCGDQVTNRDLTVDHIYPRSRGGTDDPENLWDMCRTCNSSKGQKLISEWLKKAAPKVIEHWRGKIPPAGRWDPSFYFIQRRRLIPVVAKDNPQLLVRLTTGEGGLITAAQLDSFKIEIRSLYSGKKKVITRDEILEMVKLDNLLNDIKKNPKEPEFYLHRSDYVKILGGPHAGLIGQIGYIDYETNTLFLTLRSSSPRNAAADLNPIRCSIDANLVQKVGKQEAAKTLWIKKRAVV